MVGAIIPVRMESERLPGKALLPLGGKSILQHVVDRVFNAETVEKVVVVMPCTEANRRIQEECDAHGYDWRCGGSDRDVLGDFYETAREYGMDPVVRVTGDCPLVSPEVIDECVHEYERGCDYCGNIPNLGGRTFPRGLDTEVFSFDILDWMNTNLRPGKMPFGSYHPDYRKHVTFFLREHPELFVVRTVEFHAEKYRMCVDTREEYERLDDVFSMTGGDATWFDVMRLWECRPDTAVVENEGSQKPMKWRVW